jgi:hypothetical protein
MYLLYFITCISLYTTPIDLAFRLICDPNHYAYRSKDLSRLDYIGAGSLRDRQALWFSGIPVWRCDPPA